MTTYSISLDDVDLAWLPMPTRPYNNFLKKENYQFQVKTSAPEPTTQYTCHICAIEVPVAFAYEHAASVKHRANVRIASVAAERMRAFICALPPPHVAQPSSRFCENCATEVEEGHEKTKDHRAAALLDSLLWDLMKAYIQDDDEPKYHNQHVNSDKSKLNENVKHDVNFNNNYKENKSNIFEGDINKNEAEIEQIDEEKEMDEEEIEDNCETDTEKHSEDDEANVSSNENEISQSINSDTPNNDEEKHVAEKGINVNWLEHYKEELRICIDANDYFVYSESYEISIELNEYSLRNINSENFHSYKKIYYTNNIKCIVCDCVLDYEEAEVHKDDSKHMRRIAKFGSDGQYLREIDEFYSHCILCNDKVKNVDRETHIQSSSHDFKHCCHTNTRQINKTKAIAAEKNTKNENGIKPTEKNTAITNESSLKSVDKTVDTIEYPYELTAPGKLRCVVCECQVPSGMRNREQHINGFRHRTAVLNKKQTEETENNTEETLADTSNNTEIHERDYGEELRKYVDDNYFFEFKEDADSGMFRLRLDDNILETEAIRFHSFCFIGDDKYKCQVCDCNFVNFDDEDYEEHKYDLKHLRLVANLDNDGHFMRKIDEVHSHCILCNDKMENKDVASHKQSEEHKMEKERIVSVVETDTDTE